MRVYTVVPDVVQPVACVSFHHSISAKPVPAKKSKTKSKKAKVPKAVSPQNSFAVDMKILLQFMFEDPLSVPFHQPVDAVSELSLSLCVCVSLFPS